MRRFGFFVDNGGLHAAEARFFESGFQLDFAEAEPLVGIELAGFFEFVFCQIEDENATAGLEDTEGFGEGALRVQRMV